MPKIDIAVATAGMVSSEWWRTVTARLIEADREDGIEIGALRVVSSALPDFNKNKIIASYENLDPTQKGRNGRTDMNKAKAVIGFLGGDAEYVFMLDDDTAPPKGVISHMLNLGREAVAGLYFMPRPPFNPIAYKRDDAGMYWPIYNYTPGELKQVDSVGLGCTLIHRSVFEKIMEGHELFQRQTGSLIAIPKDQVVSFKENGKPRRRHVSGGFLHEPVVRQGEDDNRAWPFFAMEYGRTEDHHFWELAEHVGIKPWLDTTIVCNHWKLKAINREAYKAAEAGMAKPYTEEARERHTQGT